MSAAVYRGCVVSGGNAAMLWTVVGGRTAGRRTHPAAPRITISVSACLSVCSCVLYAYSMSKTTRKVTYLIKFSVHVTCDRGSCDGNATALCTSGFVDDVRFSLTAERVGHNQRRRVCFARPIRQLQAPARRQTTLFSRVRQVATPAPMSADSSLKTAYFTGQMARIFYTTRMLALAVNQLAVSKR